MLNERENTMQLQMIWERALPVLKDSMTSVSYNTWITPLEPVCISDGSFILQTQNEVSLNTLRNLYTESVAKVLSDISGAQLSVMYILPADREKYDEELRDAKLRASFMLNPKFTFDTFVIGGSNDIAYAAANAVADNPARAYNPLFIYGGVGLGKTHLMHAIGNHIHAKNPRYRIIYVTSETFTNELIESIKDNTNSAFRNKYRNVDVLMVDDIQFIAGKNSTQEEFFNTFNSLHTSGRQIVISSDRPPREMVTLEERLCSRFEGGLITDIQPPDVETRVAILKKKALSEGVEIDDRVLLYIAEKVNSNIRQLEGSLTRLIAYSRLTHKNADIALADVALRDIVSNNATRKVTVDLIQQIVADYFGIELEGLASQRRTADVTFPRQIAMFLCREMTEKSLKAIGKEFGGRDYSTVISACNKITDDVKNDPELELTIENIRKRIRE